MRILAYKTILNIYCRPFSKYLTMKEIAENFKTELEVRSRAISGVEDPFNLSILLSTRKKPLNVAFKKTDGARPLRR